MKKQRFDIKPYLVMAVIACFTVAGIAGAQYLTRDYDIENYYEAPSQSVEVLTDEEMVIRGMVETEDKFFEGSVSIDGEVDIDRMDSTVEIDLDFRQATSSPVSATYIIAGKQKNTTYDKLCSLSGTGLMLDIAGAMPMKLDYEVNTSTCSSASSATCGDGTNSFTATTSYSILTFAQTTSTPAGDVLNADDNEGTYTREVFKWPKDAWLIITADWTDYGGEAIASSSDFTIAGGNDASGKAHLNCIDED